MPIQLLDHADSVRRAIAPGIALKRKSALGQFMTPAPVAQFMASLFPPSALSTCTLLDAGAGVGALSCAFLDRDRSIESAHKTGEYCSPLQLLFAGGSRGLQAPECRLARKVALATGLLFMLLRCDSRPKKPGRI